MDEDPKQLTISELEHTITLLRHYNVYGQLSDMIREYRVELESRQKKDLPNERGDIPFL